MATAMCRHRKNEIKRLRRKAARQRNVLEKLGAVSQNFNEINI